MFKKKHFISLLLFLLILSGCANSSALNSNQSQPDWVRNPYRKYDRQTYVAAVGSGSDRQTAERNAMGNLVAFFGQDIQVNETVSVSYFEAVSSGAAARWSETTVVNSNIITSAGMDSLVAAEIGDVWHDGNRTYYAIAVMNKRNAIQIYSQFYLSNQIMINNLINMPPEIKHSLEGFSQYNFAATIADINFSYATLLSLLGAPSYLHNLKKGDEYRLEANKITPFIPIGVRVRNDNSGKIQSAFTKAFSDLGFRSGTANSRYMLEVNIQISSVNLPNDPNRFARLELNANLIDTRDRAILFPYNFSIREGHNIQTEAENRAFMSAEQKINNEYKELLSEYLSRILPIR